MRSWAMVYLFGIACLEIYHRGAVPVLTTILDIRHHFRYRTQILLHQGHRPGDSGWWSKSGACGRGSSPALPGSFGHQPPGIMTGAGGATLDWDRRGG